MRSWVGGAVVALVLTFPASMAFADSCWDPISHQPFDCNKPPPGKKAYPKPPPGPQGAQQRSQQLREAIDRYGKREDAKRKWVDAAERAQRATDSAALTSDPTEKAQFRRDYDAAMRDLRDAGNDIINNTDDAELKKQVRESFAEYQKRGAEAAREAGIASAVAAAPPAPAAAPRQEVFSICEPPQRGITTCYEIPRTGSLCRQVAYQMGERTWERPDPITCSAEDLQARTDYFLGKKVGSDELLPDPTELARQQAQQPAMTPQCRKLVGDLVQASQANDGQNAVVAYAALKKAGGCGILDKIEAARRPPAGSDPRFIRRGDTPMLDQTVVVCDQNPERCAEYVDQLRRGTSPEAVAAMYANAIGVGLQIGMTIGAGVLAAIPPGGGGGGGGGVTYYRGPTGGYGGPQGPTYVYRGHRPGNQSTITGLGR